MSSLLDVAVRRAGAGGFDRPVAVLAGAAAATMVSLMPIDVLQNLVLQSGLPDLLPAAEPPLGGKARAAFAAVAAVAGFLVAYAAMRLIGRGPNAARTSREEMDEWPRGATPAPRVRRRDLHPDAPVRAPLLRWLQGRAG